ncbi:MAG: peptide-methionine (S)-S-oxide reductase MsrA [Acidimicrobiia bacterium]
MISPEQAIVGRDEEIAISGIHHVNGLSIKPPFPEDYEVAYFALGCFWGAEKLFWNEPGVYVTAVGYQGGYTKNPTYEETCTSMTGHSESVLVVFDPKKISYKQLVILFFEAHDPTQYMGQGNDIGTQYRSAIFAASKEQYAIAKEVETVYNNELLSKGMGEITTEIVDVPTPPFYYAEEYHQQYLSKNPNGYCSLRGTGVSCPIV